MIYMALLDLKKKKNLKQTLINLLSPFLFDEEEETQIQIQTQSRVDGGGELVSYEEGL